MNIHFGFFLGMGPTVALPGSAFDEKANDGWQSSPSVDEWRSK
ncbi:hypothetical protein SAMN05216228_10504 [Rhizobium tibeticum]|uniref:Uncharacterized protein n=1 Tax=Rhizobium tibeticum TaxID=501024 RepID=A0A1H8VZP5_9HYPH|nr:hypothetical protein RTCCBAU85039_6292 [Rhizobium tibeticum]SEP20794.1 hypothetical protein SAMN05216228_10504 [Rhizobium tibeticum]